MTLFLLLAVGVAVAGVLAVKNGTGGSPSPGPLPNPSPLPPGPGPLPPGHLSNPLPPSDLSTGLTLKSGASPFRIDPAHGKIFDWTVSVQGTPEQLQAIQSVHYVLHPSFTPNTKDITQGPSFAWSGNARAPFEVWAQVSFKNGRNTIKLTHWVHPSGQTGHDGMPPELPKGTLNH